MFALTVEDKNGKFMTCITRGRRLTIIVIKLQVFVSINV
jgi:hypothetical protein